MKYQSGGAFRRGLETRLRNQSNRTGTPLLRLRKMVAFDRFLARVFQAQPNSWVLKGGLALQLRLGDRARTTMDIDLLSLDPQHVTTALREASALDLGDWFRFIVPDVGDDSRIEGGGTRHTIQALLDARVFERFHIDVGFDAPLVDPVEYLHTPDLLGFADLERTRIPCYPITQQIAEKLHAYTRPHKSGGSSRVKDFIDMLLMVELDEIEIERLQKAIQLTYSLRDTHVLQANFPPPPPEWRQTFNRLAREVGLIEITMEQGYLLLREFFAPVLGGQINLGWDPETRSWQ